MTTRNSSFNPYPAGIESYLFIYIATNIEPGQPSQPCILSRLYYNCWPTNFRLTSFLPKNDNGQFQKWNVADSIQVIQQVKG